MKLRVGDLYSVHKNMIAQTTYRLFHSSPVNDDVVTIHKIEYYPYENSVIYYTSLATGCWDVMSIDMFIGVFEETKQ